MDSTRSHWRAQIVSIFSRARVPHPVWATRGGGPAPADSYRRRNLGAPFHANLKSCEHGMVQTWGSRAKKSKDGAVCRKGNGNRLLGHQGVLLVRYMEKGMTINSETYCQVLTDLHKAIKKNVRDCCPKKFSLFMTTHVCIPPIKERSCWKNSVGTLSATHRTPRTLLRAIIICSPSSNGAWVRSGTPMTRRWKLKRINYCMILAQIFIELGLKN